MSSFRRVGRAATGLGALLFLAPPAGAESAPCCFANPQYTGNCVVQPGEGESCASILAYLNNPQSQGKSYCDNTSVRGGWKQVECAAKQGASRSQGAPPSGLGANPKARGASAPRPAQR